MPSRPDFPVHRKVLTNGLTVLLKEIHTAPLISQWIFYRVGSRYETTGFTGISHWVEHMQFKGTPRFPPGLLDKAVARQGGMWNAFTFLDWTTYYETLPSPNIDLALQLEADRMVNSLFNPPEVESERTVILAERQGNENEPLFLLSEAVQSEAFQVHPYRHEVIGKRADLEAMQRDDLYHFYRRYYVPNNAVLALAGDFKAEEMLQRVQKYFGEIPASPPPTCLATPEPLPTGERRVNVQGPGETTFLQVSYRAPAALGEHFFSLAVLDSLLSGPSNTNIFGGGLSNKTSRLYQALVEKELATSVSGGFQATIDPFLYSIISIVHPQRKSEEVLQIIDAEIEKIQKTPPGKDELARAVKQAKALFAYGSESITNQAFWMGFSEMVADYDWFLDYLDNLAAVTPESICRTAGELLRPDRRVIGVFRPFD